MISSLTSEPVSSGGLADKIRMDYPFQRDTAVFQQLQGRAEQHRGMAEAAGDVCIEVAFRAAVSRMGASFVWTQLTMVLSERQYGAACLTMSVPADRWLRKVSIIL